MELVFFKGGLLAFVCHKPFININQYHVAGKTSGENVALRNEG